MIQLSLTIKHLKCLNCFDGWTVLDARQTRLWDRDQGPSRISVCCEAERTAPTTSHLCSEADQPPPLSHRTTAHWDTRLFYCSLLSRGSRNYINDFRPRKEMCLFFFFSISKCYCVKFISLTQKDLQSFSKHIFQQNFYVKDIHSSLYNFSES